MHSNIFTASTHPDPRVQHYFTASILAYISMLFYVLIACIAHGQNIDTSFNSSTDIGFVLHFFLTGGTVFMSIIRVVEYASNSFDEYVGLYKAGKSVTRIDGVIAVLWACTYIITLPFVVFGSYRYPGVAYLLPVPMILGLSLTRFFNLRIQALYYQGGYRKVSSDEAEGESLPQYEERQVV